MIPLSEDERLSLVSPRQLDVLPGERNVWDEVTVIGQRERRSISLDIRVAPHAKGNMTRIFEVPEGARLTIYHLVRVGEGATWQNVIVIRGKGEVRIRRALNVYGREARIDLGCVAVMHGKARVSVADEIFSQSAEAECRLQAKIVLNDDSKSEARARIVVGEQAHGSSSFEKLDHLLFGDHTTAAVIPELDVKTDDVKCGHGATTTKVDDDQLFYLTSRGLSKSAAEQMLVQGFLADGLKTLPEKVQTEALEVLCG